MCQDKDIDLSKRTVKETVGRYHKNDAAHRQGDPPRRAKIMIDPARGKARLARTPNLCPI
jgi:hypothetical protein